jgi:hypothetical protein
MMSISEAIWGTLKTVVIDLTIRVGLVLVAVLLGISWLLAI